ncbi:hypothetical protein [Paenibacillus hexagrammi]|uniref:Uncharacterized protein n=1 Tax=Paenibacillus hexagrammi TaxID=2908839 RepID=A0ABY3SEU3_9BACL|nr:hypothetical protein [Paenibacillus sp. YPD9-1]UJF31671.1 hypothetical protein L0M14_17995 [Paenibacillus sp. YPD9-1]
MLPNMIYSSEKMMQWQQQELEKQSRGQWMWSAAKQPVNQFRMLMISLFFFV